MAEKKISLKKEFLFAAKDSFLAANPGVQINALSQKLGLLTYSLSNKLSTKEYPYYLGEYGEIILDQLGGALCSLRHNLWDTHIRAPSKEYPHLYINIHQWTGPIEKSSLDFGFIAQPITTKLVAGRPIDQVVHVRYNGNQLDSVLLGNPFAYMSDKIAPSISVFRNGSRFETNEVLKRTHDNQNTFSFTTSTRDGQVKIVQVHEPSGAKRAISVPQTINMQLIAQAAYHRTSKLDLINPFYQPPWQSVPNLLRAHLTYQNK